MRKFLRLAGAERRLLAEAAVTLALVRLALALLPFKALCRWADGKRERPRPAAAEAAAPEPAVRAVGRASRLVPGGGNCLARALTLKRLLSRRGCPSELRLGVAPDGRGRIKAHAWLESRGRILIGNVEEMPVFTAFPTLEGAVNRESR